MESDASRNDLDSYQCEPGICVFINNTKFECGTGLKNLPNGDKDEASLRSIFKKLGFDVRIRPNLTAAKMEFIAEEYSKMPHTGAFFLIISSHGGPYDPKRGIMDDAVCGTDGVMVKVHDLEKHFHATNCPSLAGIPKVFMIDACRGGKGEPVHSLSSKSIPLSASVPDTSKKTRAAADIMTIFASTRGHTASYYDDENEGSILIQTFAQVIEEVPADKNLTDIMKKVQRKIQELCVDKDKKAQTPQLQSTFTKDYFIKKFVFILTSSKAFARQDAESRREADFRREHNEFHRQLTFGEGSLMAAQGPRNRMFAEFTLERTYTCKF